MVAKITAPLSIARALNYNEQKVIKSLAECIYAGNFFKEAVELNFYEKLSRFENLVALNKRSRTNTLHISLNFSEREKLHRDVLIEIAKVYMQKIGFGGQPYLVYQHYDAGHPHIHIVTTNIQMDGKRISLHNLGKNESNIARKEIEHVFGLIKAGEQNKIGTETISPVNVQKIICGKTAIKRAITSVLNYVLTNYKYSSLPELNAVLKLYNVIADNGTPGSKMAQHEGLVYRVLDKDGNKAGVPIKASSIPGKPTLRYLQQKFSENEVAKQPFRKTIKTSLDWVLRTSHRSLDSFQRALEREQITLAVRENEQGIVYGLTYIDHSGKTVFNGSDIGKEYSAKAVLERCNQCQSITKEIFNGGAEGYQSKMTVLNDKEKSLDGHPAQTLETLTMPVEQNEQVAFPFRRLKKKKTKKNKAK